MASAEIHSVQSVSGNQPRMRRIIEDAGQTIVQGIAGFSKEFGNNLAALGVTPTAAVNPTPQPSSGSVPFEPSAVNITRPFFRDGRSGFEVAELDTVFLGQVGPAQTAVASDVGKQYGMTIDADNHWFVDRTKSTVGTNTVVTVTRLDPNDQSATPRGVYFVVTSGAAQLVA